jgi:tetratricopeptide (TPR) repeat protein
LTDLGCFEEAEAELQKAAPLIEKACAAASDQTAWPADLGLAYTYYGRLLRERGDPAGGLPWFARAVDTFRECAAKNPGLVDAREFLSETHAERAEALDRLGRHAEALPDWDRAIELASPKKIGIYRCFRMISDGKPGEALAAAETLSGKSDLPADSLYPLARACALAASEGEGAMRERGAARAMELLRRCGGRGYDPAEWMKHDPAFASLRSGKDFQALMTEVGAKTRPGPD